MTPPDDETPQGAGGDQESESAAAQVVYLFGGEGINSGGADVERINQFQFYDLGQKLAAVSLLADGMKIRDAFYPLLNGRSALAELLTGRPIPLGVSRPCAVALHRQVDGLYQAYWSSTDANSKRTFVFPPEEAVFDNWELAALKKALQEFETVLAQELQQIATYFVPQRGIFFTPALVDAADLTFPPEVLGHIPQKTRDDWKAAGRCLAFYLLSASGFHVARAVEGTLEVYYQLFSGKPGKTLRSWADYISALQKIAETKPAPCPSQKTLTELDQMREDYRNPIVHPRVVLTESDARMLFANGESLIIAMAQEIAGAREDGGVQAGLAIASSGPSLLNGP